MAATLEGARLTEAHRLAQGRVGIVTAQQMIGLAVLLDPFDVDATAARWLRVAVPLVERQNARSANLAASYYRLFRSVELGVPLDEFTPSVQLTAGAERVAASLTATGPAVLKYDTARGVPIARALERAVSTSAGAAQRIALDGGRSTIAANTTADPRSQGWRRVTGGNPCQFCAELAARGTVYSEATADFAAHDNCNCAAEPALGGERTQVRAFVRADITDEAREARNAAIRSWLADA
jgi:hypothetical protein